MKLILTAVTILTANLAIAAAPNVTCELNYSRSSDQGDIDMRSRTVKPEMYKTVKTQINGFELNVSLEPICAADGGPCSGKYEVKTTISKNGVSTSTSSEMKEQYDRHFAQLSVGDERVFAICDSLE